MKIHEIVDYWSRQAQDPLTGKWMHPDDAADLRRNHTLNLDFPVSPYVGQIESAPIIILGANAGFDPVMTPSEFPTPTAIESYVGRVRNPDGSDWSDVSKYYDKVNYGPLILSGEAALINACPYRSPKISEEPQNRKVIASLPSTRFNRRWLNEAVLPLAEDGKRLIVVKRGGLWDLSAAFKNSPGVAVDPAPVSPQITSSAWAAVQQFRQK